MPKYRKKPVVIDAERWFPSMGETLGVKINPTNNPMTPHAYRIDTLEGGHDVTPGDFIITGVKGELYPCKPDIFALTYEPADQLPEGMVMVRREDLDWVLAYAHRSNCKMLDCNLCASLESCSVARLKAALGEGGR